MLKHFSGKLFVLFCLLFAVVGHPANASSLQIRPSISYIPEQSSFVLDASTILPNSAAVTYSWSLTSKPAGSSALLGNANSVVAQLSADVSGPYTVELVITDNGVPRQPIIMQFDRENVEPVSIVQVLGGAAPVVQGAIISLSGAQSYDPDGKKLQYQWALRTRPAGSNAAFDSATAQMSSFVPDSAGTYEVALTVTDEAGKTATDILTFTTGKGLTIANAGLDQSATVGATLFVDAFGSVQTAGAPMIAQWQVTSAPATSNAQLVDGAAIDPKQTGRQAFTPLVAGTYVLTAKITGEGVGTADNVLIQVGPSANVAPIAQVGTGRQITVGERLSLNAARSTDANGDTLTYQWAVVSAPQGSQSNIENPTSPIASYITDAAGAYIFMVTVSDGKSVGHATVSFSTTVQYPVANAGNDAVLSAAQTANVGADTSVPGQASLWSSVELGTAGAKAVTSFANPTATQSLVTFSGIAQGVNPASGLSQYDLIVFENANIRSQVYGRTFVGGNLQGHTSDFGNGLTFNNAPSNVILTVGGQINGQWLNINNGGSVAAKSSVNAGLNLNGGGQVTNDPSISIAPLRAQLEAFSASLAALPATGTITIPTGQPAAVTINAVPNAKKIAVFNVDGSALLDNTKVQQIGLNLNGADVVVINVAGNNVKFRQSNLVGSFNNSSTYSKVIWNFKDAVNVHLDRSLAGTIFAPKAQVLLKAQVKGSLVSRSINQTAAIVTPGFTAIAPFEPTALKVDSAVVQITASAGNLQSFDTALVTRFNIAPMAKLDLSAFKVAANTNVTLNNTGSGDANRDAITFDWALLSKPAGSVATINFSNPSPTLTADKRGTYVFQLIAKDGSLASVPVTAVLVVTNTAPEISSVAPEVGTVGDVYEYAAAGSDLDGDTLNWALVSGPDGMIIDPSNGAVSWTPSEPGNFPAVIKVQDGNGGEQTQSFSVTVAPRIGNLPPVFATIASVTLRPGESAAFILAAIDPEGNPVTFWSPALPSGASLNAANGGFKFTAGAQPSSTTIVFSATDGVVSSTQSATITIVPWPDTEPTRLSGTVLDAQDYANGVITPVVGATITVGTQTIISGSNGLFSFNPLQSVNSNASETIVINTNGATATPTPAGNSYGAATLTVEAYKNGANQIATPILLARRDGGAVQLTQVGDTLPPNLRSCRIQRLDSAAGGEVALSSVPLTAAEPLPAGTKVSIWSSTGSTSGYAIVGSATVAANGIVLSDVTGAAPAGANLVIAPLSLSGTASRLQPKDSYVPSLLGEGNLQTGFSLPSYVSLGQNRAPSFLYNSLTASPRPIITADITIPADAPLTSTLEAELYVNGQKAPGVTVTRLDAAEKSGTALPVETESAVASVSVSFDASALPTGAYPYELYVFAGQTCGAAAAKIDGKVFVNNRSVSPYGSGWKPTELQQIFPQTDGSVLIEEANGGLSSFESKKETADLQALTLRFPSIGGLIPKVTDLNNDGFNDFLFTESGTGSVRIFLNQGGRSFVERPKVVAFRVVVPPQDLASTYTPGESDVDVGDFNNDGIEDIVLTRQLFSPVHSNAKGVAIAYGTGGGFFKPVVTFAPANGYGGTAAGDINNNNYDDIVVAGASVVPFAAPVLFVDPGFNLVGPTTVATTPQRWVSILLEDLERDGDLDIVTEGLSVYLNNNGAIRQSSVTVYPVQTSASGGRIGQNTALTQLRGVDLLLGASLSDVAVSVAWYDLVRKRFVPFYTHIPPTGGKPASVQFTDINGDGRDDLLFQIGAAANAFFVAYQKPDELGFETPVVFNVGHAVKFGKFTDFDNDGVTDLLTSNRFETFVDYGNAGAARLVSPFGDFSNLEKLADGGFKRTYKDGTTVIFDAEGRQTSIADANGNSTSYAYDAATGSLTSVTDPAGLITQYTYANGQLTQIADPDGRVTLLTYDTSGNMTSATYPDASSAAFAYDEYKRLLLETDQRGQVTTHSYDPSGRLKESIGPDGGSVKMTLARTLGLQTFGVDLGAPTTAKFVAPKDRVTLLADAKGNEASQEVNEWGAVIRTTDPIGRTTIYERDANNLVTAITAPSSVTTTGTLTTLLAYDSNGNVIEKLDAFGTPLERGTTYVYEPVYSRVTKMSEAIRYSGQGVARFIAFAGFSTNYTYDAKGNLLTTTNPDATTSSTTYNANGQPLTMTDERGKVTTYAYDSLGRMATITDPVGTVTRMVLDGRGNPVSEISAEGTPLAQSTNRVFDSLNRVTRLINGESEQSSYSYDPAGNLLTATDPTGILFSRAYDSKGRIATLIDASSGITSSQYDLNDNITKVIAADGSATTMAYDTVNRVSQTTDALGVVRRVAYDARDNIIAITDGRGSTTTFEYDVLDRQISRTNPVGNVWRFEYDGRDLRTAVIKPDGVRIAFTYDARGRMTIARQGTSGSTDRVYRYDAAGNITYAEGQSSFSDFTYDDRNLMLSADRSGVSPRYRLTYTYDALGRRVSMFDSASASTRYTYDRADRLLSVRAPSGKTINLDYDDAGRRVGVRYPNGLTTGAAFETPLAANGNTGRLASISHGLVGANTGSVLNLKLGTFNYGYDTKGNITGITESGTVARTRNYTLDPIERLTAVTDAANCSSAPPLSSSGTTSSLAGAPCNIETYTLDEEGNRITSHKSSVHVTDPANRLQEDQTHTFEYDVNGNMVRKVDKASGETWSFGYTLFDELASANRRTFDASGTPQSSSKTYGYDGFGRLDREVRTSGTISQKFMYYDGEHVVAEADPSNNRGGGNITNWYTHSDGTDDLLAITPQAAPALNFTVFSAPSQTKHYSVHTDHQGSVRAITDLGGIVINSYAYDAYGNAEEAIEGLAQRFRYTGREWDDFAGLYHYRARALDPERGKFLQEDPLGFTARDHNFYRYVFNNPVNVTDPSGLIASTTYTREAGIAGTASAGVSALGQRLACLFGGIASVVTVLEGEGQKNVYQEIKSCGAKSISKKLQKKITKIACREVGKNGADVVRKGADLEGIVVDFIEKKFIEVTTRKARYIGAVAGVEKSVISDIMVETAKESIYIDVKGGPSSGLTANQRKLYQRISNVIIKFACP
jgi:RHS repeat-associated protein